MSRQCDNMFDALANHHRRRLLFALVAENPQSDVPMALDSPGNTNVAEKSSQIEYRHVHLPKLAEYGFIDWQRKQGIIEQGSRFEEIEPLLELLAAHPEKLPQME